MCTGLPGADFLPSEDFGEIESLTFVGNGIAEIKGPGGVIGLLKLNAPAGPIQTTMTLGGVVYTTTFGSTEELIAVSGSDGQQLTIYPPSNGFLRIVYYSPMLGGTELNVPFTSAGTNNNPGAGRRRLLGPMLGGTELNVSLIGTGTSDNPGTGRRRLLQFCPWAFRSQGGASNVCPQGMYMYIPDRHVRVPMLLLACVLSHAQSSHGAWARSHSKWCWSDKGAEPRWGSTVHFYAFDTALICWISVFQQVVMQ